MKQLTKHIFPLLLSIALLLSAGITVVTEDSGVVSTPFDLSNANIANNVLTGLEINTALVAERVTILKEYPFIGVMGYAAGENPFSYPEIKLFITEAAKLVDYIILDCSSNMLNFFTPTAIEAADVIVRSITPDLRGLNYLRAHKPLLTDDKFHFDSHLSGGFDGLLPYLKEIDRCSTAGQMFKAIAYCNQRYVSSLKLLQEHLMQPKDEDTQMHQEENGNLWGWKFIALPQICRIQM